MSNDRADGPSLQKRTHPVNLANHGANRTLLFLALISPDPTLQHFALSSDHGEGSAQIVDVFSTLQFQSTSTVQNVDAEGHTGEAEFPILGSPHIDRRVNIGPGEFHNHAISANATLSQGFCACAEDHVRCTKAFEQIGSR